MKKFFDTIISWFRGGKGAISPDKLPAPIKTFISTHFADAKITYAERDGREYEVYLNNNFSLEFKLNGEWREVNGKGRAVPQSILNLLPAGIVAYVNENYADRFIKKVKLEAYKYEVELSGNPDIDLEFDRQGNFLRID